MNKQFLAALKLFLFPTLAVIAVFVPIVSWACPLCVNATPYKDGLLWAVGFLIPVPFVLAYLMYGWIRRAS
jgi:hypothetical protein